LCSRCYLSERLRNDHLLSHLTPFLFPLMFVQQPTTVSSPAFTRVEAPKMSLDSVVDIATSSIAQTSQMVATNSGDFGGALFPVFGLGILGAIILFLAPPLADE